MLYPRLKVINFEKIAKVLHKKAKNAQKLIDYFSKIGYNTKVRLQKPYINLARKIYAPNKTRR